MHDMCVCVGGGGGGGVGGGGGGGATVIRGGSGLCEWRGGRCIKSVLIQLL